MDANVNLIEASTDNRKKEKGVTTVEYAVMLVLVALAVAGAAPNIKAAVTGVFTQMVAAL